MTTQHTPGPWEIGRASAPNTGATPIRWKGENIAWACGKDSAHRFNSETARSNARLIAAAPELLEALQGYVAHIESCRAAWEEDGAESNTKMHGLAVALNNIFGDRIEEAIAKATASQ